MESVVNGQNDHSVNFSPSKQIRMSLSDLLRRPDIVPSPYDLQGNATPQTVEKGVYSPLFPKQAEYEAEIRTLRLEIDRLQSQLTDWRSSSEKQANQDHFHYSEMSKIKEKFYKERTILEGQVRQLQSDKYDLEMALESLTEKVNKKNNLEDHQTKYLAVMEEDLAEERKKNIALHERVLQLEKANVDSQKIVERVSNLEGRVRETELSARKSPGFHYDEDQPVNRSLSRREHDSNVSYWNYQSVNTSQRHTSPLAPKPPRDFYGMPIYRTPKEDLSPEMAFSPIRQQHYQEDRPHPPIPYILNHGHSFSGDDLGQEQESRVLRPDQINESKYSKNSEDNRQFGENQERISVKSSILEDSIDADVISKKPNRSYGDLKKPPSGSKATRSQRDRHGDLYPNDAETEIQDTENHDITAELEEEASNVDKNPLQSYVRSRNTQDRNREDQQGPVGFVHLNSVRRTGVIRSTSAKKKKTTRGGRKTPLGNRAKKGGKPACSTCAKHHAYSKTPASAYSDKHN